ncbi:hypothetical protein DX980_20870 (plasmid) [Burkholderia gladioli]|nr:hypothetical protein DX980_20870 [Burkholderia gladioli]
MAQLDCLSTLGATFAGRRPPAQLAQTPAGPSCARAVGRSSTARRCSIDPGCKARWHRSVSDLAWPLPIRAGPAAGSPGRRLVRPRLPARSLHHHAQPGGLLVHVIEVADAALRLRAGRVLPVGAPIEQVARFQHRWTYGVCLAALLHDIGRPMSDLRIQYFQIRRWRAFAVDPLGRLARGARRRAYTVEFPSTSERDYQAHQRLPIVLMQQLVPRRAWMWLAEDPALIRELNAFLSGQPLPNSAIADIVVAADQTSVKANLVSGRARGSRRRAPCP